VPQKPTRLTASAKNETGDFGRFKDFMTRLVAVPHSEIKAKLDAEKGAKAQRTPKASSSRASRASSQSSILLPTPLLTLSRQ
jgi:hypothetical protein